MDDHYFLGSLMQSRKLIVLNGDIQTMCRVINAVAESEAEDKLDGLFINVHLREIISLTQKNLGIHNGPQLFILTIQHPPEL